MLRADRLQSTTRKQLLEASKANCQTKLFFSSHSVVVNDNHECPTAEGHRITDDGSGREDSNSSIRFSDEADNPWIKATNSDLHFSSNVKKNNEHKGRYFQKEWFQHHNGCGTTEKKGCILWSMHFASTTTRPLAVCFFWNSRWLKKLEKGQGKTRRTRT